MTKKKWFGLLLLLLVIWGGIKLYYKTWSPAVVAANADCIVSVDVKRVRNTLIWQYITTPSQWKWSSGGKSDEVSITDMFELPDYLFIFHTKASPIHQWQAVLTIKDQDDFNKGLQQFHFTKLPVSNPALPLYYSSEAGIALVQHQQQVLAVFCHATEAVQMGTLATSLLISGQHIQRAIVQTNVDAAKHLAIQWLPAAGVTQSSLVGLQFNQQQITWSGHLFLPKEWLGNNASIQFNQQALLVAGFAQPTPGGYAALLGQQLAAVNKAINFNLDSMALPQNQSYVLTCDGIKSRTDSAITYTYDDNFNAIEKVTVNQVEEPVFQCSINGAGAAQVFQYWQQNGQLELTPQGQVFTPFPLAKTYAQLNNQQLILKAGTLPASNPPDSLDAVAFVKLTCSKLGSAEKKWIPPAILRVIDNWADVKMQLKRNNDHLELTGSIVKKTNNLPLIKL